MVSAIAKMRVIYLRNFSKCQIALFHLMLYIPSHPNFRIKQYLVHKTFIPQDVYPQN